MKPYKWKKGDGITLLWMAVGALAGLILGAIGETLGWPSPDEILNKFILFIIAIVVILSPIFAIIRIARKF